MKKNNYLCIVESKFKSEIEKIAKSALSRAEKAEKIVVKCVYTLKDYETILDKQNGVCAICNTDTEVRRLAVDHNHRTGEIRGLLCGSCNKGLGLFKDSIKNFKQAITYLEKNGSYGN